MPVTEIIERLPQLSAEQLRMVRAYWDLFADLSPHLSTSAG